jgi:hypothetical protein
VTKAQSFFALAPNVIAVACSAQPKIVLLSGLFGTTEIL